MAVLLSSLKMNRSKKKMIMVSIGEVKIVQILIYSNKLGSFFFLRVLALAVDSTSLCGALLLVPSDVANVRARFKRTHYKAKNPASYLYIDISSATS